MQGSFMSIMGYALAIFIGVVVLLTIYIILFPKKSKAANHDAAPQLGKRSNK